MAIIFLLLSLFYTLCACGLCFLVDIDLLTRLTLMVSFCIAAGVSGHTFFKFFRGKTFDR